MPNFQGLEFSFFWVKLILWRFRFSPEFIFPAPYRRLPELRANPARNCIQKTTNCLSKTDVFLRPVSGTRDGIRNRAFEFICRNLSEMSSTYLSSQKSQMCKTLMKTMQKLYFRLAAMSKVIELYKTTCPWNLRVPTWAPTPKPWSLRIQILGTDA